MRICNKPWTCHGTAAPATLFDRDDLVCAAYKLYKIFLFTHATNTILYKGLRERWSQNFVTIDTTPPERSRRPKSTCTTPHYHTGILNFWHTSNTSFIFQLSIFSSHHYLCSTCHQTNLPPRLHFYRRPFITLVCFEIGNSASGILDFSSMCMPCNPNP